MSLWAFVCVRVPRVQSAAAGVGAGALLTFGGGGAAGIGRGCQQAHYSGEGTVRAYCDDAGGGGRRAQTACRSWPADRWRQQC